MLFLTLLSTVQVVKVMTRANAVRKKTHQEFKYFSCRVYLEQLRTHVEGLPEDDTKI